MPGILEGETKLIIGGMARLDTKVAEGANVMGGRGLALHCTSKIPSTSHRLARSSNGCRMVCIIAVTRCRP